MKDLTHCVVTPNVKTEGFAPLGVGVHRASTIVFQTAEDYANRGKRGSDGYSYGLYGTPTTRTLEAKLTALEKGARTFLVPSGQPSNFSLDNRLQMRHLQCLSRRPSASSS